MLVTPQEITLLLTLGGTSYSHNGEHRGTDYGEHCDEEKMELTLKLVVLRRCNTGVTTRVTGCFQKNTKKTGVPFFFPAIMLSSPSATDVGVYPTGVVDGVVEPVVPAAVDRAITDDQPNGGVEGVHAAHAVERGGLRIAASEFARRVVEVPVHEGPLFEGAGGVGLQVPVALASPAVSGRDGRPARAYVFTAYDCCPPTDYHWSSMFVRYAVWQKEICPVTNRPHHQGYIELSQAVRFTQIKALFPGGGARAWFGIRKGTPEQARAYCCKERSRAPGDDAGPWEWGIMGSASRGRGGRPTRETSDAEARILVDLIKSGCTQAEIIDRHPGMVSRHAQLFRHAVTVMGAGAADPPTRPRPNVVVLHGAGGTGKSCTMSELFLSLNLGPERVYFRNNECDKFWPLYKGQDYVVFEEAIPER